METPLALLPDRVTVGSGSLRCARVGVGRRSRLTVLCADGSQVAYSHELICRRASAPTVGVEVTVAGVVGRVSAVSVMDSPGPWMRHARVYVTTRSDIVGPLLETVTVYPTVETVDIYNTPRRVPDSTGITMAGRLEDVASSESEQDGQRRVSTWRLTVDLDLSAWDVDAYSTLTDGSGYSWAFDGDPVLHRDPTGLVWSTATLRRTGQAAGS